MKGENLMTKKLIFIFLAMAITTVLVSYDDVSFAHGHERNVPAIGVNAGSDGSLSVIWSAPIEDPRDYRLNWGSVDSNGNANFASWRDGNSTTAGNAYPSPSATSYTITGLDPGTYAVRIRSRYVDNKNGGWLRATNVSIEADEPEEPRDDPVLPPPVVITPEPTEEPEVAYSHFGFGIEVPSSGLIYSNVLNHDGTYQSQDSGFVARGSCDNNGTGYTYTHTLFFRQIPVALSELWLIMGGYDADDDLRVDLLDLGSINKKGSITDTAINSAAKDSAYNIAFTLSSATSLDADIVVSGQAIGAGVSLLKFDAPDAYFHVTGRAYSLRIRLCEGGLNIKETTAYEPDVGSIINAASTDDTNPYMIITTRTRSIANVEPALSYGDDTLMSNMNKPGSLGTREHRLAGGGSATSCNTYSDTLRVAHVSSTYRAVLSEIHLILDEYDSSDSITVALVDPVPYFESEQLIGRDRIEFPNHTAVQSVPLFADVSGSTRAQIVKFTPDTSSVFQRTIQAVRYRLEIKVCGAGFVRLEEIFGVELDSPDYPMRLDASLMPGVVGHSLSLPRIHIKGEQIESTGDDYASGLVEVPFPSRNDVLISRIRNANDASSYAISGASPTCESETTAISHSMTSYRDNEYIISEIWLWMEDYDPADDTHLRVEIREDVFSRVSTVYEFFDGSTIEKFRSSGKVTKGTGITLNLGVCGDVGVKATSNVYTDTRSQYRDTNLRRDAYPMVLMTGYQKPPPPPPVPTPPPPPPQETQGNPVCAGIRSHCFC